MAELPLVPWRRPGDVCPVCKKATCQPDQLYDVEAIGQYDEWNSKVKLHAMENLYKGDVQPLSHHRLEITRADGAQRTVMNRKGHWTCNGCNGSRSEVNLCQDIATAIIWLGIRIPQQGPPLVNTRVRNQGAWDQMANNWREDFPVELRKLVEAAAPYMPPEWRNAKISPVDRVVAAILQIDSMKALRYADADIRAWAIQGILEQPFSYGSIHALKSYPGIATFLHQLRRLTTMPFNHLTKTFGTDASGFPCGSAALYQAKRQATRERQEAVDEGQATEAAANGKPAKMDVGDKPQLMVMFGFIRETCMISELGFYRKNLKLAIKEGVHMDAKGDIIIRGEQPWVWPMIYNTKLLHPTLEEYHGDKGEYSEKLFLGGEKVGVVIDVPHKSNFEPAGSGGIFDTPKGASTRKYMRDSEDPEAFVDRYHWREIDEGNIGGFKREMRSWLRNITPQYQEVELLLMTIKWNLKWALYERHNRGIHADYATHAARIFEFPVVPLEQQALRYSGQKDGWRLLLRDLNAAKESRLGVEAGSASPDSDG